MLIMASCSGAEQWYLINVPPQKSTSENILDWISQKKSIIVKNVLLIFSEMFSKKFFFFLSTVKI